MNNFLLACWDFFCIFLAMLDLVKARVRLRFRVRVKVRVKVRDGVKVKVKVRVAPFRCTSSGPDHDDHA
jgi:hypothetical protein